ncbi:hypothetical protein SAMN02746041_02125 [Desulfacinum hydrothermale DSM 13146]|uniref:Uncharacterized protein n=1 Tax=Desulfacinum hydrothermale DSM 13146 TaxID=1121390 RepID=A0A1W1XLX2_9BACT|nr:hypothetical protein [Desulfacinum hydrothermale]SMC24875.1 hypothetical protein SAMN02746041_02125 [Desulfacinum hydrothermale DSM 13146]
MGLELLPLEQIGYHQSGGNLVSEPKDHKPDIMTELLQGNAPQVTTRENDLIERLAFYLKRLEQRAASPDPAKKAPKARPPRAPRPKKKATYYLTKVLLRRLDEAQQTLKELSGESGRPIVSKSLIVELALKTAIQDLERSGRASRLVKLIGSLQAQHARAQEKAGRKKHGEGQK